VYVNRIAAYACRLQSGSAMNRRLSRFLKHVRLRFGRVTHHLFGWSPRCVRVIPARRLKIWYEEWVDIATAEKMVRGQVAVFKNPMTVVKQYSKKYLRTIVLKRDGRCVYCGRSDLPLTLDHVIPRAKGGLSVPDNLVAACEPCNQSKGSSGVDEWLRILSEGAAS
jgi:hypothetical protein